MADVLFVINELQSAAPRDARRFESEIRAGVASVSARAGEWFRCWIRGPRAPEGLAESVSVQIDVAGWATTFAICVAVPTGDVRRAVDRAMRQRSEARGVRAGG